MKKALAILLTLALMCAGLTVFAGSTTVSSPGDTEIYVQGKYAASAPPATVYHVDVSWGSMEFTYNAAPLGSWDPSTHSYVGGSQASWTYDTNANVITVKNHSNAGITASFDFEAEEGFDVQGAFSNDSFTLATAVGKTLENTPTGTTALTISGGLDSGVTVFTKIGTVTVTISS
jgi:hypothetical protein